MDLNLRLNGSNPDDSKKPPGHTCRVDPDGYTSVPRTDLFMGATYRLVDLSHHLMSLVFLPLTLRLGLCHFTAALLQLAASWNK